jgi:hypothetical protein
MFNNARQMVTDMLPELDLKEFDDFITELHKHPYMDITEGLLAVCVWLTAKCREADKKEAPKI